jgi:hypothetical protein
MDNYDSESNTNKNSKTKGFFSYVFDFNEQRKQELINLGQYVTLGFIFYTILVYVVDIYFPKIDDTSSSIEIIFTLLLYLYIIFYSVYFIDRIISYFHSFFGKPLSGTSHSHELLLFPLVTPILLAIISFNPQFQDGTYIIFERLNDAWNGKEKKQKKKNKSNPQPQQPPMQQQMITQQPITNSLYSGNTTPINQLPVIQEGFTQQQSQPVQQFTQDNSNTAGQESFAPMAANEVMGGSFGSSFGSLF